MERGTRRRNPQREGRGEEMRGVKRDLRGEEIRDEETHGGVRRGHRDLEKGDGNEEN